MAIFLLILRSVVQYRTILFPAIVGFIGAVATAMGRKIDIGRVQALVDATSVLATAGAAVIGAALDANNAKTKAAITANKEAIADTNATAATAATRADVAAVKADVAATKLTEVVQAVNTNADLIDPSTPTNPLVTPPQYVDPTLPPQVKP